MQTRFCGNCGTEVDGDASFCPTCGQPLDQAATDAADIPPAPAWPAPEPGPDDATPGSDEPAQADAGTADVTEASAAADAGPPPEAPPPAATPPPAAGLPPPPPPATAPGTPAQTSVDVPITWPVTLSGWLVGGGAALAALGFLAELLSVRGGAAMSVIFLLLMAGVAATVFFSASVPAVPHLRLVTLGVAFTALGVALDRLGFNSAGIGTVLVLLGAGAAAAGVVIAELGRDRPMSGPMGGAG